MTYFAGLCFLLGLLIKVNLAEDELEHCTNNKAPGDWECDDFEELVTFHHGAKLPDTLKCFGYDKYESPKVALHHDQADPIMTTIVLRKINALDTSSLELTLDVEIDMKWSDARLKWPADCYERTKLTNIKKSVQEEIWHPYIHISDISKITEVSQLRPSRYLTLNEAGNLTMGGRFEVTQECELNFEWFPFDIHVCSFDFHLTDTVLAEMKLDWQASILETTDVDDIRLPDWDIIMFEGESYVHTVDQGNGESKEYSGLSFHLEFDRVYANHLLHTYIPSAMLCCASACSVFVPSDLVPGRMALCITTFLSIISLFNGAKGLWPKTSYMKAIDLWTLGCYIGVFYALAEYCIILFLTKKSEWESEFGKVQAESGPVTGKEQMFSARGMHEKKEKESRAKKLKIANKVEKYSRLAVPIYFGSFIFLYWLICLVH